VASKQISGRLRHWQISSPKGEALAPCEPPAVSKSQAPTQRRNTTYFARPPCSTTAEPGVVAKGMTASATLLGTWRANEERRERGKTLRAQVSLQRCLTRGPLLSLAQGIEERRAETRVNLLLLGFLLHGAAQSKKSGTGGERCATVFLATKSQGWKSRKPPTKKNTLSLGVPEA
jgi:hypothetical protein